MATTPVEMPYPLPVRAKKFILTPQQSVTPVNAGFIQSYERAPPMWMAEYETIPLKAGAAYNDMQSFLQKLNGAEGTFLGYDPRRPSPQAHVNLGPNGTPWHDTITWTAGPFAADTSYANSTISIGGLPIASMTSGLVQVTKGDYISVKVGNIYYLHRVQENRIIATNAGSYYRWQNLSVTPRPVWTPSGTSTLIRYQRPVVQMKMIGGYEEQDTVDGFPSFKWRGVHFVDRT